MCNKCLIREKRRKYSALESKARALYFSSSKEDLEDVEITSAIQNAIAHLQLILKFGK
jgi:hypothetical protein